MNIDEFVASRLLLTTHELQYLISLDSSTGGVNTGRVLGVPDASLDSGLPGAGATTLVVRGLAKFVGQGVELGEQAGVVGFVVNRADSWITVALSSPAAVDEAAVIVRAGALGLILTPGPIGIFEVLFIAPEVDSAAVVRVIVEGMVARDDLDCMLAVRAESSRSAAASVAAVRTDGTRWRVGSPVPSASAGELHEDNLVESDQARAVDSLLSALKTASQG